MGSEVFLRFPGSSKKAFQYHRIPPNRPISFKETGRKKRKKNFDDISELDSNEIKAVLIKPHLIFDDDIKSIELKIPETKIYAVNFK